MPDKGKHTLSDAVFPPVAYAYVATSATLLTR